MNHNFMKVLVRGNDSNILEFSTKFKDQFRYDTDTENSTTLDLSEYDVVFDFFTDEFPENPEQYIHNEHQVIFCNTVKTTLAELSFYLNHDFSCTFLGFNGLPSFFDRELLELTVLRTEDRQILEAISSKLGFEYTVVEDRVGMVTPRVICMIINEAYFTVQEGTAEKEAVNHAMKLGTNYPFGPFEWAERIGISHVYELLEALYDDTKDERYKISPLLKREYLLLQIST